MSTTDYYAFHDLNIAIRSDDPAIARALYARLRQFSAARNGDLDLEFEFNSVSEVTNHRIRRPLSLARPAHESESGEVVYFDAEDQLYISYNDWVRVLCSPGEGWVKVSVLQSKLDNLWLISHPMFTFPFVELMKRQERYVLHAASLSVEGRGVLLTGHSGAGKSTLAITLLRGGFDFLGDDMVFLAHGLHGLRMLSFPDEIDVTDETARMFPELEHVLSLPKRTGWPKQQIWPEEIYGVKFVRETTPAVLLFPEISHQEKSTLRPMDKDKALFELIPNVIMTEQRSSQAHLDILSELVKETDCYHLQTGRDFEAIPALLKELLV
jgi:hypothetical protein